jgi:hypothetical protein
MVKNPHLCKYRAKPPNWARAPGLMSLCMGSGLKIGCLKWAKPLLMHTPLVLWDIPKILGLGLIPLCAHTPLQYTLIKLKWVIFNKHHQGPNGKKDFGKILGACQEVMGSNPMSSITFCHMNPLTNPMVLRGSP